jgi:uncharacterized membrane protein HdeD (DUF308 family)
MGTLIFWGLALIVLGVLAVALPYYFTLSSVIVFGAILVASGLTWLFYNLQTRHGGAGGWVKPFILILIGALFLLFPEQSIVVLAVFLLIYLLTDAFGSFFLAFEYKGKLSSWFLMLLNGIVDLILAGILIYYLPNPKVLGQIFGILIGVSLIIDGTLLVWFGWRLKLYYDKYKKLLEEGTQREG